MRRTNGRLVILVAAVAVGAVVTGGALAYRQAPKPGTQADAAPLSSTPSATPSRTGTPSTTTTTTPRRARRSSRRLSSAS